MSCYGGPEITNDGLVLYYDMNNTQKSWKGAPVVNNVSAPDDFNNGTYWDKTTYPIVVTSNTILAPDNTLTGDLIVNNNAAISLILQTISTTIVGTGALICSIYVKAYTASYFTFNCYYQGDTELNPSFYMNGTSDTGTTMTSVGNGWYRCSMTVPARVNAGTSLFFRIWPGGRGLTNNLGFYFWGAQIDTGFLKPYVNGSRTTSTALLDLTNSNTLTTTSLTYASDNTFSFNGTSNYVDVANTSSLQFLGTLPYTLEAWVYPTANPGASNYSGIFNREYNVGLGRDGFNMYFLGSAGTSTYFITERFCSGVFISPTVTLDQSVSVNNWSYLVATYDGSNLKLYRNGTLQSSIASANNITNATTNLTIGKRDTNYFNGKISLAKVYNTALSADQVKQNFNATRGRYGI